MAHTMPKHAGGMTARRYTQPHTATATRQRKLTARQRQYGGATESNDKINLKKNNKA